MRVGQRQRGLDHGHHRRRRVSIAPPKDITLAAPVSIVSLIGDPSNSKDPNAIPDFNNGMKLAVDEINSVGGIGGHPITFEAIDTSPTDPNAATNSLNLALGKNPTVILGPASSTIGLALAPRIAEAKVPDDRPRRRPAARQEPAGQRVAVGEPAEQRRGRRHHRHLRRRGARRQERSACSRPTPRSAPRASRASRPASPAPAARVSAERAFEFNATDLTEPITAMSSTDAIVDWGTPNTLALSVTTMAQQAIDKPHLAPGSVGLPVVREGGRRQQPADQRLRHPRLQPDRRRPPDDPGVRRRRTRRPTASPRRTPPPRCTTRSTSSATSSRPPARPTPPPSSPA